MDSNININKPTPIQFTKTDLLVFKKGVDVKETIQVLEKGKQVLIATLFSDGLLLLKELQNHLRRTCPNKTFQEQRDYRAKYHQLSNLIVVEVKHNKLKVKKAPAIGWIEKLYPEVQDFFLTLPQIQGLNSSWQWYQNGILLPVLRNKLHPYYGTYFPTRYDHLILFDNWLKRYEGPKKSAIDVGIGSGVLAFQMVGHGFQKVFGTDTNPNVIVGLKEFMGETKLSRKVELDLGNLFGKWDKPSELIVFNPPWLPAAHDLESIDEAIYYNDNLFPDFFKAAKDRLLDDGELVVIFSNLAQITNVTKDHPIEKELAEGGRFVLKQCLKRPVKLASTKTKRDQSWRELEEVELWILKHK